MNRAVSTRVEDSTRTTVAPKSASARPITGPATTQVRSRTFSPASGAVSTAAAIGSGAGRAPVHSASTSSVCSPSSGAGRRTLGPSPSTRANRPGSSRCRPPSPTAAK
jgi:hypothetical protein